VGSRFSWGGVLRIAYYVMSLTRFFDGAAKFDRVESFLFGSLDHDFDVGGGGFEFELELSDFASEIVEWNESQDRDSEAAHGCDQRLADAAGNLAGLVFNACVADDEEGSINSGDGSQQSEQRRKRDERVHDSEKSTSLLEFSAGSYLQCALQGGMEVIH